MNIKQFLEDAIGESSEIDIEGISLEDKTVSVLFPYDSSCHLIKFEGTTKEEIADSFRDEINQHLQDMIDHLEDCKLNS
ncbi:hypothetical protein NST33_18235 [Paenibacillus sp. FSL L8-0435]|uniref:hypothetical protein n=1 Tax=Paenibacillus sp. FSL L8-0435 TaxID=2954618 RepID=UPI0030DD3CF7